MRNYLKHTDNNTGQLYEYYIGHSYIHHVHISKLMPIFNGKWTHFDHSQLINIAIRPLLPPTWTGAWQK